MQQGLACPNCGAPVNASQQFCGVCGSKTTVVMQPPPVQSLVCPNCGTPVKPGQPFCGICGTKLTGSDQQSPAMMQLPPVAAAPPPPMMATPPAKPVNISSPKSHPPKIEPLPASQAERPAFVRSEPMSKRNRRYGTLNIAGSLFQVVGWIVLIGGVLTSIGMLIFVVMGGKFESVIPGVAGTIQGGGAIIMALASIIFSIICGVGLLAFAEICYAFIALSKKLE